MQIKDIYANSPSVGHNNMGSAVNTNNFFMQNNNSNASSVTPKQRYGKAGVPLGNNTQRLNEESNHSARIPYPEAKTGQISSNFSSSGQINLTNQVSVTQRSA